MGGSSKKQTVGYKYYLGMHMILTHGPADFLRRITVDSKTAASGFYTSGPISINKPNLFGGEKREGGVVGTVDFKMGEPTQGRNDYLQARLGSNIPAFRGVVGVVLRQVYLGVNPYLKRWAFRLQRINVRGIEGQDQWYKSKAPIGSFSNTALYLAIDISNSMANVTSNGKTRLENMKAGLEAAFTPLLGLPDNSTVDITVVAFAGSYVQITRRGVGGSDIQDIIDWINARDYSNVANGTTEFDVAIGQAPTFFAGSGSKDRVSVFITDGEATGGTEVPAGAIFDSISGLTGYGINIDLADTSDTAYLDNTPQDGIPVVSGGDTSAIENAVTNAIFAHFDMNPAHIIRECLTDLDWGMGYQESDIDDVSFTAAADTLYNENMGISLLWDRQNSIEGFVQEIIKHIDAALYVDRKTGKFVLKLIRADYDENTLIELDESNVGQIQNLHRPSFGELVNSVTVNYWDYQTGETSSLTVQDTALAIMQEASINTTVQYPGFSNGRIAARAAARDLKALSIPLWSCTVYADKTADALDIGDTFKLSWADYGLSSVIMRVTGMAFGNSKSNRVKLICTQDVFALPDTAVISAPDPDDGWTPIDTTAQPLTVRLLQEAPYYEIVTLLGQTTADSDLAANPDLGFFMISAGRPSSEGALNASTYVDPGTGVYEDSDVLDFSPYAYLAEDIDENTLTFNIENGEDLDLVEVGQHCEIEGELCRVDAISETSITIGRAILDTSPRKHLTGALILFWDNYPSSDETEYVASDSINVKLLTVTGSGILDEGSAPVDNVVMNNRAIRPYPPGDLRIDGQAYPAGHVTDGTSTLTWVHRDRLQQTSGTFFDHSDGSIGPEAGTTYRIKSDAILGDSSVVSNWLDTNVGNVLTWEFDPTVDTPPVNTVAVVLKVFAERDGYESWQAPEVETIIFGAPTNLSALYAEFVAPTNLTANNTFD